MKKVQTKKKKQNKKKLPIMWILAAIVVVLAVTAIIVASVSSEEEKRDLPIETKGLLYEDGTYTITVPNATKSYNLTKNITLPENVTTTYSKNKNFSSEIKGNNISLTPGNNTVYLKLTDNDNDENTKTYVFNIYRKQMVTVSYQIDGEAYTSTVVEEGTLITPPSLSKPGHNLKWSYNFDNPITAAVSVIKGEWIPNDCVINAYVDGESTSYDVKYGEVPSGIVTPDKFGYRFVGWKYGDVNFDPTKPFQYDENEIDITAVFAPISYTIQYVIDSSVTNSTMNVGSFTVEDLVISLFDPTHSSPNYKFVGWYVEGAPEVILTSITLEDVKALGNDTTIVLLPKWRIESNVKFDVNGGDDEIDDAVYGVGDSVTLPVLVRDNFQFIGWYDKETLVTDGIWNIATDVTLVAKWLVVSNDIHYEMNGGTNAPENPNSFDKETDKELLDPTYDDKHIFDGWYTSNSFSADSRVYEVSADMLSEETVLVLYANWFTIVDVELDANGGECEIGSTTINSGAEYALPTPTRDKYVFTGWYYNEVPVNISGIWSYEFDLKLVAKWTPKEFTVNYELNGGTNHDSNLTKYTVETDLDKLVLADPTKAYCTFLGWFTDLECTQQVTSIDREATGVTLYAKWEHIKVTINYDANGGAVSKENETINLGDNYILPTPVLSGYKFMGWYLNDELVPNRGAWTDENVLVLDLVAKWELEKYTIEYDLNGGNADNITLKYEYTILDEDFKLPTPSYDKNHYFVGWSLNGGVSSPSVVVTKGSTGNRVYKAIWTENRDATTGLLFSMINDKFVVVGIDREINDSIIAGIKIPSTFGGIDVVAIESYAFKEFGEKFSETTYANMQSSYVTIYIPTSIKRIGANAFDKCNGIKVSLDNSNGAYTDYKEWDKTVTWETGNTSARDCVWGFRPAIGWTRYSLVEIPDDYE